MTTKLCTVAHTAKQGQLSKVLLVSIFLSCFCQIEICSAENIILPEVRELCSKDAYSSVKCTVEHSDKRLCLIEHLVLDRNNLTLIIPNNDYKPAGSNSHTFQVACGDAELPERLITNSFGFNENNANSRMHSITNVGSRKESPEQCDVVFEDLTVLHNRDWHRNVWHRVVNDIFPAFQGLLYFGLLNASPIRNVHIDFAKPSYEDLYRVLDPELGGQWLHLLPESLRYICFDKVIFLASRGWSSIFDAAPRAKYDAIASAFGEWLPSRMGLSTEKTLGQETNGAKLQITWIDRDVNRTGYRAIKNQDDLIAALGERDDAVIVKVKLEDLSFHEQMRIIRNTDILLGVHGAGLTFILHLQSHSSVIEVLPAEFAWRFYEGVAKVVGHTYYVCQQKHLENQVEFSSVFGGNNTKFSNMILPLEQLKPVVELSLQETKASIRKAVTVGNDEL